MKIKIFQPILEEKDRSNVDSNFTVFDNCANPHPEFREYWINQEIKKIAIKENLDLWGSISLAYKTKITCDANYIVNRITTNPGYDVYFFNGFLHQVARTYNVWEDGEHWHSGIVKIVEAAFPLMGIDPKVIYLPMGSDVMFFACYCIANRTFWDGYLNMVNDFLTVIPKLPNYERQLLFSGSNYSKDPTLWYFPFIQERLFSTYLLINKDKFKILPYHESNHWVKQGNDKLEYLLGIKELAIKENSKKLFEYWKDERNKYFPWPNICAPWIDRIYETDNVEQ